MHADWELSGSEPSGIEYVQHKHDHNFTAVSIPLYYTVDLIIAWLTGGHFTQTVLILLSILCTDVLSVCIALWKGVQDSGGSSLVRFLLLIGKICWKFPKYAGKREIRFSDLNMPNMLTYIGLIQQEILWNAKMFQNFSSKHARKKYPEACYFCA